LPDVVDAAWGGTLVPPGNTRALADAMRELLDAQSRVDGVGAAARSRMLDRFSPSAVAAAYTGLYREVTRDGR